MIKIPINTARKSPTKTIVHEAVLAVLGEDGYRQLSFRTEPTQDGYKVKVLERSWYWLEQMQIDEIQGYIRSKGYKVRCMTGHSKALDADWTTFYITE